MIKLSAIATITLLLIAFWANTLIQAQQQQQMPPLTGGTVPPPPDNSTDGHTIDPLSPPWTIDPACAANPGANPPTIEIKFPPGIISANMADAFRLEPEIRFLCGGETKIRFNWTISPPPPKPFFRPEDMMMQQQSQPPMMGSTQPPMMMMTTTSSAGGMMMMPPPPGGPQMGHERTLTIPPGTLDGEQVYEVALVAYGYPNDNMSAPLVVSNHSAFIRARRVNPSIDILGGSRRAVRVGTVTSIGIESTGLQDIFNRHEIHCCKIVDPLDIHSACASPCPLPMLPPNAPVPNFFNSSLAFETRFNRSINVFNFSTPGLFRVVANISWMEGGMPRELNSTQIVEAVQGMHIPFGGVSIFTGRTDVFQGSPVFAGVNVARGSPQDRARSLKVVFEITGNKGPAVKVMRPPQVDDYGVKIMPNEVDSLNDVTNGKFFVEVHASVSEANPPTGAPLPPPSMNATYRIWIRPQPNAVCTVARSQFDPDFGNMTVDSTRSGRSRLNITISGVDRAQFEDVSFNALFDIPSPDGINHTISVSPGFESNDRAFQDFSVGYFIGNPSGNVRVRVELGAYGRVFRTIDCGHFHLSPWTPSQSELLRIFDRFQRRARDSVDERDFRSLHSSINDIVGVLSVVPPQIVNSFPNFVAGMGFFLNAVGNLVNSNFIDAIPGAGREAIVRFVLQAVKLFRTKWANNAYMTSTLPSMLIKLASATNEQNIPDLRTIARDVSQILQLVGTGMPRNLRFRFLQAIIRQHGSKRAQEGPAGDDDSKDMELRGELSGFRADIINLPGSNAAANMTYNTSGGDVHVRAPPNQFANVVGDDDIVTLAIGRTSAALFGMQNILKTDIFDINSLINAAPQTVTGLPTGGDGGSAFEFRVPTPPGENPHNLKCQAYNDVTDTWEDLPTRVVPPMRNGTLVPQAPAPTAGTPPPAGTFPPDILCLTSHLSVFSVSSSVTTGGTTTPSPNAAAGGQMSTTVLISTIVVSIISMILGL